MFSIYYEYLNVEQLPFLIERDLTINDLIKQISIVRGLESLNDIKILKIKKV